MKYDGFVIIESYDGICAQRFRIRLLTAAYSRDHFRAVWLGDKHGRPSDTACRACNQNYFTRFGLNPFFDQLRTSGYHQRQRTGVLRINTVWEFRQYISFGSQILCIGMIDQSDYSVARFEFRNVRGHGNHLTGDIAALTLVEITRTSTSPRPGSGLGPSSYLS